MEEWYYEDHGNQQGPISKDALLRLIIAGDVTSASAVWREGMNAWVAAGDLPELTPFAAVVAPAPADAPPMMDYGRPKAVYADPQVRFQFAGFWWRVLATFIDSVIVGVPYMALSAAGISFRPTGSRFLASATSENSLFALVLEWLYFAIMESSSTRATLGKMACGLTVVDRQGNRISFLHASVRHVARILSGRYTLCIGYMMAGWTEKKQALHDKLASTYVLKKQMTVGVGNINRDNF